MVGRSGKIYLPTLRVVNDRAEPARQFALLDATFVVHVPRWLRPPLSKPIRVLACVGWVPPYPFTAMLEGRRVPPYSNPT